MALRGNTMVTDGLKADKFSEELYFMLMTSSIRDRVLCLAAKHGISKEDLYRQIAECSRRMTIYREALQYQKQRYPT